MPVSLLRTTVSDQMVVVIRPLVQKRPWIVSVKQARTHAHPFSPTGC